ncbi:MAG: hypothetical protein KKE16_07740 [Firmicutes bacterium]|nr:hypothetical protein [Bacillota bacterium]
MKTWEELDRDRENRILYLLGNDDDARKFWEWLGDEAEKREEDNKSDFS